MSGAQATSQAFESDQCIPIGYDNSVDHEHADEVAVEGFEIHRTIGKGGMATAYLATHLESGREVALKVLRVAPGHGDEGVDTEEFARRFEREGALLTELDHPNIVKVYGFGHAPGVLYIYMEYVPGGDLTSRIERGLPIDEALDIIAAIGAALDFAHEHSVIHRDVKPSNILFRDDGTPLLSDFGIAKQTDGSTEITAVGMLLGSPFYMSPEQAQGKALDGRSDLYGLGIILFEMLTGRVPFFAPSPLKVLMAHSNEPIPRLDPELKPFQILVDQMLAKSRDDRIASGADLSEAIEALRRSMQVSAAGLTQIMTKSDRSESGELTRVVDLIRQGVLEDVSANRVKLPSMPRAVDTMRDLLASEQLTDDPYLSALVDDPELGSQLLTIANSAFIEEPRPSATPREALNAIEPDHREGVFMLLGMVRLFSFEAGSKSSVYAKATWSRVLMSACVADELVSNDAWESIRADLWLLALTSECGQFPILQWAERVPHIINEMGNLQRTVTRLKPELSHRLLRHWQVSSIALTALEAFYLNAVPDTERHALGIQPRAAEAKEATEIAEVLAIAQRVATVRSVEELTSEFWRDPVVESLGLEPALASSIRRNAIVRARAALEAIGIV
jgi:serine/threonine protein kinase